jgi:endonuclease/exonuclease/phosphatase family metal-dependent hydrolase
VFFYFLIMDKRIIAAVLALCLLSCQNKPGRIGMPAHFTGVIPDTITVVSYNVENFFDLRDNGDEYPEYKPGQCNWTKNTFAAKCNNIASVLAALHADVAVLVEVESEDAVAALCAACRSKGIVFPFYALGNRPNKSNTMPVVLSRFPVLAEQGFGVDVGPSLHARNMVRADIYLGNDTLTVFGCHWPSKKFLESKRLDNAKILARQIEKLPAKRDYIIAGDFNSNYDECETFHTDGLDDTKGLTGINHVLKTAACRPQEAIASAAVPGCAAGATPYCDPWLSLPRQKRMSTVYQGRSQTPDHILLPASMFDSAGLSYVNNSFTPFTWNGRLLKNGTPFRWQMRYEKQVRMHVGEGFSDHLPLSVMLCRSPYQSDGLDTIDKEKPPRPLSGTGPFGFETGCEGWVACAPHMLCEQDTLAPAGGRYCLKIAGTAKANACAARSRLGAPKQRGLSRCSLLMSLRGKGTLTIRVRVVDTKQWSYFNGPSFTQSRAAKYFEYLFPKWKKISLSLSSLPDSAQEIEAEIRAKKGADLELWIDDVSVR